jgi:hypothetical protein
MFMIGHFMFLMGFRELALRNMIPMLTSNKFSFSFSGTPSPLTNIEGVWIATLFIFASHGVSFLLNFIQKKEYERISPIRQMFQPYSRIFVMQITLLLGAFLCVYLGNKFGFLIVFWALKMALDIHAHLRERRKLSPDIIEMEEHTPSLVQ